MSTEMVDRQVSGDFTKALPKTELHAHLSGSISRHTLHDIWQKKQSQGIINTLGDPAIALKPNGTFPNILSFFQIFSDYIYSLVSDAESIFHTTQSVAEDFRRDGVRYLELRTTPREIPAAGISRVDYVALVMRALAGYHSRQTRDVEADADRIEIHLILSVDRKMTAVEAEEIVDLAGKYRYAGPNVSDSIPTPSVVGIDLCGNPTKGDISSFTSAFQRAKTLGLSTTVHFAEVPASSTEQELSTLLSWNPDRLGHAINIPAHLKEIIKERKLGLELCLSCNVLAEMTQGGFKGHHFGEWTATECQVALSTDDVGVFESALSNEYFIAAREFGLSKDDVIRLALSAVGAAFAGKERMRRLIDDFAKRADAS